MTRVRLLALLGVLGFSLSMEAVACSCAAGIPIEQDYQNADAAFIGQVTSVRRIDPNPQEFGDEIVEHIAEVSRGYKGPHAGQTVVLTSSAWGNLCGVTLVTGTDLLIFGRLPFPGAPQGRYGINLCDRIAVAAEVPADIAWLENQIPG